MHPIANVLERKIRRRNNLVEVGEENRGVEKRRGTEARGDRDARGSGNREVRWRKEFVLGRGRSGVGIRICEVRFFSSGAAAEC